MKKIVYVFIISLVLFAAGNVMAELDKDEKEKIDILAQTLNLDSRQKTELIKEREKSKEILIQLEKKWQILHNELRQEVRKDNPDTQLIDKFTLSIGKIRGEIISLRTKSLIFLKSILNEEQKKILKKVTPEDTQAQHEK